MANSSGNPLAITPGFRRGIEDEIEARQITREEVGLTDETQFVTQEFLNELEAEMMQAAESLEFERAAQLRDRIMELKQQMGAPVGEGTKKISAKGRGKRGRRGGKKKVPRPRASD